jgi:CheY-like chemotaxis protein
MERLRSIKDRTVLALAPDQERLARIVEAVGGGPIEIISAATAAEAKAALDSHAVHAVVVHAAMGEIDQRRFIHAMQHPPLPVILFSDRVLNAFPHDGIRQYADRANISVVDTPDQLLLSLILCLHLMPEALNDDHRDRLRAMDARQSMMKGRKVLLVDDDMRTVFAVTNVLEDQGAEVLTGKTGKESLDKLDAFPDIDLDSHGCDDRRGGRLPGHTGNSKPGPLPNPSHYRPDSQSHERRPVQVHLGRGR